MTPPSDPQLRRPKMNEFHAYAEEVTSQLTFPWEVPSRRPYRPRRKPRRNRFLALAFRLKRRHLKPLY